MTRGDHIEHIDEWAAYSKQINDYHLRNQADIVQQKQNNKADTRVTLNRQKQLRDQLALGQKTQEMLQEDELAKAR